MATTPPLAVRPWLSARRSTSQHTVAVTSSTVPKKRCSTAEGIKWNAPSFRTTEYFATTNLREKKGLGVILHRGAKVRGLPPGGLEIKDPEKLLVWLGQDRAMIVFAGLDDFLAKKGAFEQLVRQWVLHV